MSLELEIKNMRPVLFYLVLVGVLTPASVGVPLANDADDRQGHAEHSRQKRAVLTAIREVGCGAYTAVKECTTDLDSCGGFCDLVDFVCSVVSHSGTAVSLLCDTNVDKYESTVMDDYRYSSHGTQKDAERFIMKLGEDIQHLPKSFWEKLANFFKEIWKRICGWFSG
ncbi:uncharacterized protein LOC124262516 isoform X2 [Haliotis rubra]|uniref:uncharacterized protein LOC124262516 isoform X2 n=1 Tax=Haliotis rubra TaxID=36100 RepID=UPI001EE5502D|nr:uncharacterized protein LOC124262516 isoform X2 [Haliotis rubra]